MSDQPTQAVTEVSCRELFSGFCQVGLSGFGGVMPFARRALLEDRRWLTPSEFNSLVGLSQFLPGANIGNLAICVGSKFQGWRGAIAAFSGLMAGPFCVILLLGALYDRFGDVAIVQRVLDGIATAGAGLILATGLRMGRELRDRPEMLLIATCVVLGVALGRWPLAWVIGVLGPVALAAAWWRLRPTWQK